MFAASIIRHILKAQVDLSGRHWGMQLRAILTFEIYKKSLRRTNGLSTDEEDAGKRASQGKIVNLMSSDTNQIRGFLIDIHQVLVEIPCSIIISITGLLIIMGTPALAGLGVLIISGPLR